MTHIVQLRMLLTAVKGVMAPCQASIACLKRCLQNTVPVLANGRGSHPESLFLHISFTLSPPDHLDNKQAYHAVATMDTKFHEWLREGGARIIAVECAEVQEGYRGLVANAAIAAGVIGVVRMSSSFPHSILKMKEIAAQQVIFL